MTNEPIKSSLSIRTRVAGYLQDVLQDKHSVLISLDEGREMADYIFNIIRNHPRIHGSRE